jgi:hypothetical protein
MRPKKLTETTRRQVSFSDVFVVSLSPSGHMVGHYFELGRTTAQAAGRWLLISEIRVQSCATSSEIRGGRSGTAAGLFPSSSVSSANHISTIAPRSHITAPRGVR